MKLEYYRQIFEKYSNIKFHENPSSRSRDGPRGQTDMTKLIVAFRELTNAPKNKYEAAELTIWSREVTNLHGQAHFAHKHTQCV